MTKTYVKEFFPVEYKMLHKKLKRAFLYGENDSLILLARSKQTIHALVSKVQQDMRA